MYYAKVIDGTINAYGTLADVFPSTSFPLEGPGQDFLDENNVIPVIEFIEHNSDTHRMVFTEPYIEDGKVYHVKLEKFTKTEAKKLAEAIAAFEALQEN